MGVGVDLNLPQEGDGEPAMECCSEAGCGGEKHEAELHALMWCGCLAFCELKKKQVPSQCIKMMSFIETIRTSNYI